MWIFWNYLMRYACLCIFYRAGPVIFVFLLNRVEYVVNIQVEFQTASGQMIDLITTIEGEKDLSKYSLPL